jgi:hypothetical protein
MTIPAKMKLPDGKFSDVYRRIAGASVSVREPILDSYLLRARGAQEQLVQQIWFEQKLRSGDLRTEDGRRVRVISPGWWNVEPGPDFLNAEIQFDDDPPQRMNVEAHLVAADWRNHGHHRDTVYNSVGLHVFFTNDDGETFAVSCDGTRVPQIALGKFLAQTLQELLEGEETPENAKPVPDSPCRAALTDDSFGPDWVGNFLDAAGDERMLRKAEQFERELAMSTFDQVVYEAIMETLGYKNNRIPFRKLARRLPVTEIKRFLPISDDPQNVRIAEAMLLGVGGFIADVPSPDDETRAYLQDINSHWSRLVREFEGRAMRTAEWDFASTRPLNYPTRRISGAAAMLATHLHRGIFRAILEALEKSRSVTQPRARARMMLQQLTALFDDGGHAGYWSRHCTLGGKSLASPHRAVGDDRAAAMAVNVIIPMFLCDARRRHDAKLEAAAHEFYCALAKSAHNNRTRYVAGRLFASDDVAAKMVKTARRQQGLMQLYADCCNDSGKTCEDCALLAAMGART